ncbi:MAG: zinc ribbon domain-containing protein [Ilumatobacteraceae bacterium]|nr:zinc ribbon domain-containing protein [Ilumatobacteraceae bacterium]
MFCNRCGALVSEGQRFCAECGHSLAGITDPTEAVETVPPAPAAASAAPLPPPALYDFASDEPDDLTAVMLATDQPTPVDPVPVTGATTDQLPLVASEPASRAAAPAVLPLAVLTAILTVVAATFTILEVSTDLAAPTFEVGSWRASTFASNLPVAAFVAVGAMAIGLVAAVLRQRWGSGLVGGAALSLSGWAMLMVGLADEPIALARAVVTEPPTTEAFTITIERGLGYWMLPIVAGFGVITFVVSLLAGGNDGRDGLNPWVAAAAAVTALVAAIGPLIPQGIAEWDDNWTASTTTTSLFLAGRLWQMAMLAYGAVLGFLLVRRYGLGLAIGSTVVVMVMTFTSLLDLGTSPMGPAVANPGAPVDPVDLHAVTIVGAVALLGMSAIAVLASFETAARERDAA